jgi:hypothetical protein
VFPCLFEIRRAVEDNGSFALARSPMRDFGL